MDRATMPVLLDTDIGGDIDDANALALLMASPEVQLVGVTTVGAGGSARRRAEIAAALLDAGGHGSVGVSAGFDEPIRPNPVLQRLPPDRILNAHERSVARGRVSELGAVERILDAARTHQRELVLLCTGCLTNLAATVRDAPEVMQQIGRIVVMGGAFHEQAREANVAIDPEAADVVFRAGLSLEVVGFEVARRVHLPLAVYRDPRFAGSRLGAIFGRMAGGYATAYGSDSMTLYDVTAAAAVTHPELFTFAEMSVAVELTGTHSRGMTIAATDGDFNAVAKSSVISVARRVDADAVERLFRDRVLGGAWP